MTHKVNHLPRGRNSSSDHQRSGGAALQSPVQLSSARRRSVNIRRAGDEPQLEADKRGASFSCSRDGAPGQQHTDLGFGIVQCLVEEFTRLWAMDLSLAQRHHQMSH